MDEFGDYRQVINIVAPPVEDLDSSRISREMARVGNESLAELVARHPDRFAGGLPPKRLVSLFAY
jgi:aminocarboxymuconate-semialdehyde decarboxylase